MCGKKVVEKLWRSPWRNRKGLTTRRRKSFCSIVPETGLEPALPLQEPGPQPNPPALTSFDQDWKNVGSYFLTNDLRSNSEGLRFAWSWSTWTNTALFLPYETHRGNLIQGKLSV